MAWKVPPRPASPFGVAPTCRFPQQLRASEARAIHLPSTAQNSTTTSITNRLLTPPSIARDHSLLCVPIALPQERSLGPLPLAGPINGGLTASCLPAAL